MADTIKAKIEITADTSGAEEAAAALEKLQGITGTSGDGAGVLGDQLEAMGKQASSTAGVIAGLADETKGFQEATSSGEEAIVSATEALGGHQQAIEDVGAAYEALQEPVGTSIALLGEASPPMTQIAERAQELSRQITPVSEGFVQIGAAIDQIGLPQFADSLHQVSESFDPKEFGLDTFAENMAVFQDALVNPMPFTMIRQYLNETGQTWDDFNSSIGEDNVAALTDMAQNANVAGESINNLNAATESTGKTFTESYGETQAFTEQYNALGGAAQDASENVADYNTNAQNAQKSTDNVTDSVNAANKSYQTMNDTLSNVNNGMNQFGGVGSSQYGPQTFFQSLGLSEADTQKAMKQMGLTEESSGLGGTIGSAFEDLGNVGMVFDQFMRPLMMAQMAGQMVMQVGQAIYDSAAIAEGPGAHGVGTFTGTVDALGQSMQAAGQTFSEGFGQNILPTLNALNYEMNQGGGGSAGGVIGSTASFLSNLGLLAGGLTTIGLNPFSMQMIQAGGEGLINMGAQALGFQQPFQGPGPVAQAQINYQQQLSQTPQTVSASAYTLEQNANTLIQQGLDPNYLQQQDNLGAAQQFYQRQQASYNAAHPISPQMAAINYQNNLQDNATESAYQQYLSSGGSPITPSNPYGSGGGPGGFQNFSDLWKNTFGSGGYVDQTLSNVASGINSMTGGSSTPDQSERNAIGDFGNIFSSLGGGNFGGAWGSLMRILTPGAEAASYQAQGSGGFFDSGGGCFIAGTPILLANGTEKPIEQLQMGEQVIGYDGNKAIPVTIQACLTFLHKQTYELTFSDGRTLTLTDSHPLYSPDAGWKSLSPAMTREESPDLPVSQLEIGDIIATIDGTCTLIAIEKKQVEQVYNVTVDGTHTYYANGVLTHNIKAGSFGGGAQSIGSQIADQVGSIQLPHIDLGSIGSSLAGAFSGIQLPHLDLGNIGSTLAGAFGGIQLPHLDLGNIGSALSGAFSGIQLPHIPDIGGMINGALGGMFSGITLPSIPDIGGMINGALGGVFSGITLPSIPNIGGMINGALSGVFGGITIPSIPDVGGMINGALGGVFSGIKMPSVPDVSGMINGAMGGMFSGITLPSIPNIGAMLSGAMSGMFSGLMIPAFASGVEGFGGGLAVVGEAGPELVALPGGSSVYPMSTNMGGGLSPISLGGGSGGAQTANISVYLDSQMLISLMGMSLQSSINVGMGKRSY